MLVNRVKLAARSANEDLFVQFNLKTNQQPAVKQYIEEQICRWERYSVVQLDENNPFTEDANQFSQYALKLQSKLVKKQAFTSALNKYLKFCQKSSLPSDEQFWRNQIRAIQVNNGVDKEDDLTIPSQLLLKEWQKALDKANARWELAMLAQMREELLCKLANLLDVIQQLEKKLSTLGLDVGLLFDLSEGALSPQDIQAFQRWLNYLNENDGVKELCDLLGKMRQIELSEKLEKVRITQSHTIQLHDINSREEIVGIRLGRDIEHALPSELALLSDPETALLFDLKFVESRLMCFEMQGMQALQKNEEREKEQPLSEKEKLGPMVICVDTSGSMQGMPETIAKAVTLFMSCKAKEQKRPCYLINFSTGLQYLDLGPGLSMESVIEFLSMSFHGGTDVAPALGHALEVMQKDDYRNADLLIISDFIVGSLPVELKQHIEEARDFGNSFYSLVVGSAYMTERLTTLFDHEWVFNPKTSQIHELISFKNQLSRTKDSV